jgi:hypothetical protein
MAPPWHETRWRGNLVDMHIPDWHPDFLSRLDSEAYADLLQQARVQVAYLYASSCLGICYWPTKVGHAHDGLHGRDSLGERLTACHARGMEVVVYCNWWSKWAYDTHPDWRVVTAKGENTADYLWTPGHYGVCCFNSPYADFVLSLITELCLAYTFEGLWVDMIFWPYTVCYCSHCRRRYHDESGKDLPKIVNWEDPEWVAFQRRREAWMAEVVGRITATARRLQPGVSVGHQCAAWSTGWPSGISSTFFAQNDYLSGDFYGGAAEQSFISKLFTRLTEKPRFEFMTSRCPDLSDHTTMKSRDLLEAQAFSALAHNGRFLFIDAIDPVGTMDPRVFAEMGSVLAKTLPYEPFLAPPATPLADVGIYFNFESLIDPKENGRRVADLSPGRPPVVAAITNLARTLMHGHIAYAVLTPKDLDALAEFAVIVVPELFMISQREVDAFRRYVAQGGRLYVSRSTSLLTVDGEKQADFLLADVLGVNLLGQTTEEVTYMAPTPGNEAVFGPCTVAQPLTIMGSQMQVAARASAQVLATVTRPYTDPKDPTRFGSAISNPPGIPTAFPAAVLHPYGQGQALYVAGCLERMEHEAHREIFRRLLGLLAPPSALLVTDAPKSVEILLFDQVAARRLVVAVLNFQAELPNIPVTGIRLRVRLDGRRPGRLQRLPEMAEVPCAAGAGYLEFEMPRLETFLLFALDYEPA